MSSTSASAPEARGWDQVEREITDWAEFADLPVVRASGVIIVSLDHRDIGGRIVIDGCVSVQIGDGSSGFELEICDPNSIRRQITDIGDTLVLDEELEMAWDGDDVLIQTH